MRSSLAGTLYDVKALFNHIHGPLFRRRRISRPLQLTLFAGRSIELDACSFSRSPVFPPPDSVSNMQRTTDPGQLTSAKFPLTNNYLYV